MLRKSREGKNKQGKTSKGQLLYPERRIPIIQKSRILTKGKREK
jgi:hypothetical protein